MTIVAEFFHRVKAVLAARLCYACRTPIRDDGIEFAGRTYCDDACIPAVYRDLRDALIRARESGAL